MRPELIEATSLLRSPGLANLEQAIRLLQKTVYSFSMKVCGHLEDAEDTAQEVLLKSVPYLPKIESPQALAVWLYKVARNRCWMSRRRSKFAPKEMLALEDLMPDSAELQSLSSRPQQTPEAQAISSQESERLHQAILRIPPNYRLVLVLHDMEGLTSSEVANITGLQEGTVRVRLHRARLFVRRELANAGPAPVAPRRKKPAGAKADCREMFANLSEYIDGRIDDVTCQRMRIHLEDCPPCVAFINDLKRAIERCQAFEAPCQPAASEKLHKLLAEEYSRLLNRGKVPGRESPIVSEA